MTQPKEKDPVKEQDSKHEDEEFQRILDEQQFRRKELEKVRNLTRWP
jgi:hypothetical protein